MNKLIYTLFMVLPVLAFAGGTHDHDHHHNPSPAGKPGEMSAVVTRMIKVDLLDNMQFKFENEPNIKTGETVRFVVRNVGKLPHEFSIGTDAEHKEHRIMMREHPDMEHVDGNTITVPAGETRSIVWTFGNLDAVMVACNIPGHFEAGMKYTIHLDKQG